MGAAVELGVAFRGGQPVDQVDAELGGVAGIGPARVGAFGVAVVLALVLGGGIFDGAGVTDKGGLAGAGLGDGHIGAFGGAAEVEPGIHRVGPAAGAVAGGEIHQALGLVRVGDRQGGATGHQYRAHAGGQPLYLAGRFDAAGAAVPVDGIEAKADAELLRQPAAGGAGIAQVTVAAAHIELGQGGAVIAVEHLGAVPGVQVAVRVVVVSHKEDALAGGHKIFQCLQF